MNIPNARVNSAATIVVTAFEPRDSAYTRRTENTMHV